MHEKERRLDTEGLFDLLESSPDLKNVLKNNEYDFNDPTLQSYLAEMLETHGFTIAQIVQKTNLSKSFIYQIFSGDRVPSRDILIVMAFVMKLTIEETQRMLTLSRRGVLYPRVRRDSAIIFCLQKNYSLDQVSELLDEIGETPLV